jgi:hypothetical protein
LSDSNLGIDVDPFDKLLDRREDVQVQAEVPIDGMEDRIGRLGGEPNISVIRGSPLSVPLRSWTTSCVYSTDRSVGAKCG